MEKSKKQKNKVRFVVVREFSGEKSMRDAFAPLIERQHCGHFEGWRHEREMVERAAEGRLIQGQGHGTIMVSCPCS